MLRRFLIFTYLSSLPAAYHSAAAITQPVQVKNSCQSDPHFRDFDFWLGHWSVKTNQNGQAAGKNIIKKSEADCLITEQWTNTQGGTGFSINYYNPASKLWRQVWVSAPGVEIDYTGGLNKDGQMVLTGTITTYQTGQINPFRGTWTPNADGTVRQLFEQQAIDGTWSVWFDGIYTRIK